MKPALLPTAALGFAVAAFFLPPVLALSGAAPTPHRPAPMLVVQSEPVTDPALAAGGRGPTEPATPVRARVTPSKPGEPMVPQFTRIAANVPPTNSAHD
jgi:hypothetical protein